MIPLHVQQPGRRVERDDIERLAKLPVANISDVMARLPAGGPRLRPYHASGILAGTAYTVRTRPGDNLMIHKALNMAAPGDVLVIDGGGDLSNALLGEMMLSYAEYRGLAGVVVNGSVRDVAHIRAHAFPVYAAGVTHRGPYKDGPGEVNVPVAIDGMVINPGDAIIGDDDGVVCVPYDMVAKVLPAAEEKQRAEVAQLARIKDGTVDRTWVERALADSGLAFAGLEDGNSVAER
ncbi:RraA family protein [Pelagibacterium lacus]|uniref:Putative 4-hydroxy-4-methyl-2-oxoglutarate aldolase n=1 Tax=Pelagibacterium lacus TaxID=2282655 RepID=A0A369W145_9HYPH|nr:RraA family protein [Pelagibacterium lacus]RDE07677.1 RraA family protein [Pelagibacterium lacus]